MADLGGVEFLIQLNAKLDEVTKMTRMLEKTEMALMKTDDALRKAEKRITLFGRAAGAVGHRIREFTKESLAHLTALASWEGFKALGEAAFDIGKDLLMAAAGAERTSRAFENLFGQRDARRMEEALDMLAKKTEFADDKVKAAAQELGAAGLKPLEIIDSVAVALDAAARTGKAGAFEAVITALKQIQTFGKVPTKMLKEMGLGEGAGKDMEREVKRGSNALDAFFAVVDKNSKKPVLEAALGRGKDLDVTMSKLKDLPEQYGQRLAGTKGYDKLKESALSLLEAFDPDSARGQKIFTALDRMITKLADLIKKIDVDKIAGALVSAFEKLPGLIQATVDALLLLSKVMKPFFTNSKEASTSATIMRAGKGDAGALNSPQYKAYRKAMDAAQKGDFSQVQIEWFPGLKGMWRSMFGAGEATGQGMAGGIDASSGAVDKAAQQMGQGATDAVKKELGAHSPSLAFAQVGADTAAGFMMGVGSSLPRMQQAMAGAFSVGSLMGSGAGFGAGSAAGAASGARGGPTLEANVTVNISGAGGDPQQIGHHVEFGIRQALESIMSELAAEGGGS